MRNAASNKIIKQINLIIMRPRKLSGGLSRIKKLSNLLATDDCAHPGRSQTKTLLSENVQKKHGG